MQTTSCTWPYVVPIGEDPAAHGHWCAFTDLYHIYHTIPYMTYGGEKGVHKGADPLVSNIIRIYEAELKKKFPSPRHTHTSTVNRKNYQWRCMRVRASRSSTPLPHTHTHTHTHARARTRIVVEQRHTRVVCLLPIVHTTPPAWATFSMFYGTCMEEQTCEAKLPHMNGNEEYNGESRGTKLPCADRIQHEGQKLELFIIRNGAICTR